MVTWMKTTHMGGAGGGHSQGAFLASISLSPVVTVAETECCSVCVCARVCLHLRELGSLMDMCVKCGDERY